MKANEIREFCEQNVISLVELARASGVPYVTVWRVANKVTKRPRASTERKLRAKMVEISFFQPGAELRA